MEFQRIKGYLPKVSLVHMSPQYESEIEEDVKRIVEELPISISLAVEGGELIV